MVGKEIMNREFRKLMKEAGLKDILLIQGRGYLYITSENENSPVFTLFSTSFYVNSFHDMTPKEWVEEIKKRLEDEQKER